MELWTTHRLEPIIGAIREIKNTTTQLGCRPGGRFANPICGGGRFRGGQARDERIIEITSANPKPTVSATTVRVAGSTRTKNG